MFQNGHAVVFLLRWVSLGQLSAATVCLEKRQASMREVCAMRNVHCGDGGQQTWRQLKLTVNFLALVDILAGVTSMEQHRLFL